MVAYRDEGLLEYACSPTHRNLVLALCDIEDMGSSTDSLAVFSKDAANFTYDTTDLLSYIHIARPL